MSEGLFGVIIGAAVGLMSAYLQNRWTTRREWITRSEARRDQTRERQRAHLVELRDATLELMNSTVTDMSSGTDESLTDAARMSMRVRTLGAEASQPVATAAIELYDAWTEAAEARRSPETDADSSIATRFQEAAEEVIARVGHELGLLDGPWPTDPRVG